ncbi:MAG TPA: hypothetical protein PJ997_03105, partial [Candidatus Paceibacterota bacterium]|nr:hypothetical protein [Candidatus Paceibacterota bacterium]HMP19294.1 hypothetical protein [Candidatus Paceibacterota bacterium]HMP85606.1 hypothetical protein [Candidatus Paceibacterota bacterium]
MSIEQVNKRREQREAERFAQKEKVQATISEKYLKEHGFTEIVEEVKKESPLEIIRGILEREDQDYVGMANQFGLQEKLQEIANIYGDESAEYVETDTESKNFYNSLVKYLRAQRNMDKLYLQSRRIVLIEREMQKDGFEIPEILSLLKKYNKEIDSAEKLIDDFSKSNPEIFLASRLKTLRDYKKESEKSTGETGRINETPYVKKQLAQVEACIIDGQPIFIHGHLGAGKTEMALRASYNYLKENKTNEEIAENVEKAYEKWLKNNPNQSDDEKIKVREEIEKESHTAVVISGSRETSTTDFTGHRTINFSFIEEEAKKYKLDEAMEKFKKWQKENPNASHEEVNMYWNGLLKVYLETSSGTYSNFFIGPIYRAMEEGRPVIIDEVDAIPPDSLIFLNHIMTRKPGDVLPVQGDSGQRITVQKGFCVILTGNFPKEGQVNTYLGRSSLDAAFLSRLQKLEHDYLPQSMDHSTAFSEMDPEQMKKNELFHVLVANILERYGSLSLPKGADEKLWRLACLSRHIQNIFSNKHSEIINKSGAVYNQEELRERLHKEVLSMRQILEIIREWQNPVAIRGKNEGLMRYELDHYILEYFIKRTPEEETKWTLYKIAQQFGFFNEANGWPSAPSEQESESSAGVSKKFDIESPKNEAGDLQKILPSKVVQMCYGKIPEYDYGIKESGVDETEINIEIQRELEEIEKEKERLDEIRRQAESNPDRFTYEQYLSTLHL